MYAHRHKQIPPASYLTPPLLGEPFTEPVLLRRGPETEFGVEALDLKDEDEEEDDLLGYEFSELLLCVLPL